ncbi:alpha-amylase inhibitor Gaim [Streptomyces glaucescens]|uniref:Alpha-amylase inhibitor Gaim n=1 Tax=Streptomyces glaucescens TaxID=1907 RepID=A0A089WZL3_STRGA|nr:alpha-amylase inhibitor Gaim [Streptomyces glaucescens]
MHRFLYSSLVTVAAALLATASGAAHAGAQEGADDRGGAAWSAAPECVTFSADWRYTFVTNNCPDTHTLKVVYRDGTDVPSRVAPPGAMVTFPGHGTTGNAVLGVIACDGGADA